MPDYDFKTLSPLDFEILTRDLLQKELGITLESFKPGKDGGIDLRYAGDPDKTLIVQAKHFAGSGFVKLLYHLKNEESLKVKALKPGRYIISTSVPLSPKQKSQIQIAMSPSIKSPSDIYGREDLNNLLGKFTEIEERTFKLWFTSVAVLEKILRSRLKNFSRESLEGIQKRSKIYVYNKSFQEAVEVLESQNYCVIAGMPGIGKTILAEMLGLYFAKHEFEFIRITTSKEAFECDFENHPRFIYYDDFLGQTSSADMLEKNEDQDLTELIAGIKRSNTSKLVLTTREYILNQARQEYPKIDLLAQEELKPYIIDLSKYTREIKARILYNHLYFSNIDSEKIQALLSESNCLKIIDHKNYNPRIVEHMTREIAGEYSTPDEYIKKFFANLENPHQIWRHIFENQISPSARNLLIVMATLPSYISPEDLFTAHHAVTAEDKRMFKLALKETEGTFLSIQNASIGRYIAFHNPSIRDFLNSYLAENEDLLQLVFSKASFWEQAEWFWDNRNSDVLGESIKTNIININSNKFLESMWNLLGHPSTTFTTMLHGIKSPKVTKWPGSILRRLCVIVDIAKALNLELSNYSDAIIQIVHEMITIKEAKQNELVQLLVKLDRVELIEIEKLKPLHLTSKSYLLDSPYWVQDLEPFCEYSEEFPELVADEDMTRAQSKFKEAIEAEFNSPSEDPDMWGQLIHDIKEVAKRLNVDESSTISKVEGKISDLEEEAAEVARTALTEIKTSTEDSAEAGKDGFTDHEIMSLFQLLKKE